MFKWQNEKKNTHLHTYGPHLTFFNWHYHTLGTNDTICYKVSSSDSFERFQADKGRKQTYTIFKIQYILSFTVYVNIYCKSFMYIDRDADIMN